MIADHTLPHQIVVHFISNRGHIMVSCNCLAQRAFVGGRPVSWEPIGTRKCWDAADMLEVYRRWHSDRGIDLEAP